MQPLNLTATAPAPIAPQSDPAPEAYVLWRTSTHCRNCNTFSEHSDLYVQYRMRSHWGFRTGSNLRPLVGNPQYDLPVHVRQRPHANVPFCHICVRELSLSHLPSPPSEDIGKLLNGLAGTEAGEARGMNGAGKANEVRSVNTTSPTHTSKKPKPTISDLLF